MWMNGTVHEVDAQRARWLRYRTRQTLTLDAGDEFACGGLGRHVDGLDVRLLFLPADPEGDVVPLDGEVLAWLKEPRQSPYGGRYPLWGHRERGMSGALVVYDQYRDEDGWTRYLALHRHGGIEVGVGRLGYEVSEVRVFPLRAIVGLAWTAAALYAEVVERWQVQGPVEITVTLRNTRQATLGGFAEGWAEPERGLWDFAKCLDDHLLLRREADRVVDRLDDRVLVRREVDRVVDPQSFALDLGDRVEQAFGTVHRRHLGHEGEYEGRLDPRFEMF
jgi:hypothetical protein